MEKIKAFYFYLKLLGFRFCSTFYRKIESNAIVLNTLGAKNREITPPNNLKDIQEIWAPPSWMIKYDVQSYSQEVVKNVFISPDGVVFNRNSVFPKSLVYVHFLKRFNSKYRYECFQSNIKIINEPIVLIWNHWSKSNYYHWMIESLGLLIMTQEKYHPLTIILDKEVPLFVTESLMAFEGVNFVYIEKNEIIKSKQLFLPIYPTSSGKIDRYLIEGLREKLIAHSETLALNVKCFSKVYVSRSRQKVRKVINEEMLLIDLQQKGFEAIYFEDFNFWEQIAIMRNASVLIAPHGANLVNMLVMKGSSTVIELNKKDIEKATLCYWQLARALNFSYYYVPVDIENENYVLDNISYGLIQKYIEN